MLPSQDDVIGHVGRHPGLRTRELASDLKVTDEEFDDLLGSCLDLQRAGEIVRVPRGGWDLPQRTEFRVGYLQLPRRGQGVVRVARGTLKEEDLLVRRGETGTAFPGDLVLVKLRDSSRPRRNSGEHLRQAAVVDVLERGRKLVRGHFLPTRRGGVVTTGGRSPLEIEIPRAEVAGAAEGEEVLVRLLQGAARHGRPRGRVVVRHRDEGTLEADVQIIRGLFDLPDRFSPDALAEAGQLEDLPQGRDWPGRVDLRREKIFTIDPVDSRDFDDAISLENLSGGRVRLGVHIADVSHYVKSGSLLDREAEGRSTSVYLPGRVLPMLPERLSNDLASLRPGEDRLTKTVRMTFRSNGEVESHEIFRSVIRSCRRFTYDEVLAILRWIETGNATPSLPPDHVEYEKVLRGMGKLRDRLHRRRRQRGALDLDIPSLRLHVNEAGEVTSIGAESGDPAHSLIEEFMLAANETVAREFVRKSLPLVARVHSPPREERLEDFRTLLEALDLRLGPLADTRAFQRLVDKLSGEPLAEVVQIALLRTMDHASYVLGPGLHYALATESYCHFTSPIRRYPDLLVHQILDEHIDGALKKPKRMREWTERLPLLVEKASELERTAEEAEREMTRLRLIRHLRPFVGEEKSGQIVSVHPFGFFVRLDDVPVDGMVPVRTLTDDYYEFDKKRLCLHGTRGDRRYSLGDRVRVELSSVDPDLREITFSIADRQPEPRGKGRRSESEGHGKTKSGDRRGGSEGRRRGRRRR